MQTKEFVSVDAKPSSIAFIEPRQHRQDNLSAQLVRAQRREPVGPSVRFVQNRPQRSIPIAAGGVQVGIASGFRSVGYRYAYEGIETRALAAALGFTLVAPPSQKRFDLWEYDKAIYKRCNEVERLFLRLKGFRRVFTRYEKLDMIFIGVITFALIIDGLRLC